MSEAHETGIPTMEELQGLPRWALVALAARSAARAEPMLAKVWPHAPDRHLHAVRQAVDFARHTANCAGAGTPVEVAKYHAWHADLASHEADFGGAATSDPAAYSAAHAASNAAAAIAYPGEAFGFAYYAAYDASQALAPLSDQVAQLIRRDFELIATLARQDGWTDDSSVPPDVFTLHTEFDLDLVHADRTAVDIAREVDRRLAEAAQGTPLDPGEWSTDTLRELLAEAFGAFGCEVELVVPTREAGRDVVAVYWRPAEARFLAECRRQAETHRAGLALAPRVCGLTEVDDWDHELAVTLGDFADPAIQTPPPPRWRFRTEVYVHLLEWLKRYDRFVMTRFIDVALVERFVRGAADSALDTNEEEAARLEAFQAWERAGRPSLSRDQEERQYFDALERVRRRAAR
jgi:hypothetical protein